MELCLGTVQLGMDYGVQQIKQPPIQQSIEILYAAVQAGIKQIDTAEAYGEAEKIVGLFLQQDTSIRSKIKLISKLRPNVLDDVNPSQYASMIRKHLEHTLCTLHTDYLDAYLLHSARYVFNDQILEALSRFKKEGLVRQVGVSVYETDEALQGISNAWVDFLQLPYSLLDQRMRDACAFEKAKKTQTTIHIRSVFLQGLLMMDTTQVPLHLSDIVPYLNQFHALCTKKQISPIMAALQFAKQQDAQALVFGVDTIRQLQEDIQFFDQVISDQDLQEIAAIFPVLEAKLIMPSLWSKK